MIWVLISYYFHSPMASSSPQPVTPTVWSARLVDWFFKNTQIVILLFIALMVSGLVSLFSLRSEGFPSPQINIAIISTVFRGASPNEMESQIVKPIETAVQNIKGVSEVRSTAANSFGSVVITFDATADFTATLGEVRNKVQNVTLPKDADKPEVAVPTFGGSISYYAITGAGDATALRQQGDYAKQQLEAVTGIKEFSLTQPINDKITVTWNGGTLAQTGLTITQVQQALQGNNVTIPAGTANIGGDATGTQTSVVTVAPFTSIDDVKNLTIGVSKTGTAVKLSDVADIALVSDNKSVLQTYSSRDAKGDAIKEAPALYYQLIYRDDADVTKTSKLVSDRIAEIQKAPEMKGSDIQTVFDVSVSIHDQVAEIEKAAIGGPIGTTPFGKFGWALGAIWLIMLAMLLFVSWRAAIISVLAVPLSLLFTFFALKVQGVSLNTLTLFSMVLVLALIVDPVIVLLEAIQRELDMGRRGRDAVIAAMNTIGIGAFIAVICNVLVFVPFGVVSGVFGQIIKFIPITVIPALLASYFVPLIFLTYMARWLLKPARSHSDEYEIANLWKVSQWFVRTNTRILQKKVVQVLIIVAAIIIPLGVSGVLFATGKVVPVQFSSTNDNTVYNVNVEYPANMVLDQKEKLLADATAVIKDDAATKNYFVMTQSDAMVSLSVQLLARADRDANSTEIVKRLNTKLSKLTDVHKRIFIAAADQGIGGPTADPVAVNIFGDDLDTLKKAAIKTGDILRAQPNVTRVNDGFTDQNNPQIAVAIDRGKLATTGLPAAAVAGILAGVTDNANSVTKFEEKVAGSTRTVDVILVNAARPTSVDAIKQTVLFATPTGQVITVADVATVSETQGFSGIQRLDGQRYVTVSAQVKDALKDAAAPQKAVKDYWTADNLTAAGLRSDALSDRGAGDAFLRSFRDLFIALGVACAMLYIILILFFKSFTLPFIILFAVPLSFIGVFPALALVGGQFGFLEILGVITLTGIAVNVGIFLIDLANQRRARGVDYKTAIAEASGIRFRPIFLTKVTALGGLMPLIILSPFWRSLATVVLAGVLVSGILSLFTTPILYSWFIGSQERRAAKRALKHKA
jgi:multidrug efflux pump subunit AcrB